MLITMKGNVGVIKVNLLTWQMKKPSHGRVSALDMFTCPRGSATCTFGLRCVCSVPQCTDSYCPGPISRMHELSGPVTSNFQPQAETTGSWMGLLCCILLPKLCPGLPGTSGEWMKCEPSLCILAITIQRCLRCLQPIPGIRKGPQGGACWLDVQKHERTCHLQIAPFFAKSPDFRYGFASPSSVCLHNTKKATSTRDPWATSSQALSS